MAMFNTSLGTGKKEVNYKVGQSLAHRESRTKALQLRGEANKKIGDLEDAKALGITLSEYKKLVA